MDAKQNLKNQPAVAERNLTIDRFRGLLIILMVIGDYISGISIVPNFLKHASDVGLTVADLVATTFIFVIGLNFGESFRRRQRSGSLLAYQHFLYRYLALVGIGAIISAGSNLVGKPSDWGVLQAIGVAGLISLVFIRLRIWQRFVVGALLLGGYQYLLETAMRDVTVSSTHGGFFGAISWGALLVLSTAIADLWRKGLPQFLWCCAGLSAAAAVSGALFPVSKHQVSLSFALITLAASVVAFLIFEKLPGQASPRPGILGWWGQHALALYLLHLLVLSLVVVPPMAWWYVDAPLWLAALQLSAILVFMSIVARWLSRRTSY